MIHQIQLTDLLVLDIETVPGVPEFQQLSDYWKGLWVDKISKTMPENQTIDEMYVQKAGILAEFGKIICISTGLFYHDSERRLCFKMKSISGDDESELLKSFVELIGRFTEKRGQFAFAGHNIKEFDIPYICRRMMIRQIPLPPDLQFSGRKPWETNIVDTMDLWKFGDYKNYISLKLLAEVLGISTPKDDIDGSMVREVYYYENNLPRIVTYCQKDVITVANIVLRFKNIPILDPQNIFVAS